MLKDMIKRQKKKNIKIMAYQRLFNTEDGKIVLRDLLQSCHFMTPTFDGDALESAYKEGERSVLLRLIHTINADPEKLLEYIKDNHEE